MNSFKKNDGIAGWRYLFDAKKFVEQAVQEIRARVRSARVITAASGGVDSTVVAVLMNKALGARSTAVFVDTGLLREGEVEGVRALSRKLGFRIKVVNASREFFEELRGVTSPERKRKIVGRVFVEVFEREAKKIRARWLAQGTIAPDWIESGTGIRARIKTHHNVAGLPLHMKLRVIEPLRDLYKDEVRQVARAVGVPERIFSRQPFPGPGLAVRVVGEVTPERVKTERRASAVFEQEIDAAVARGEIKRPWQYFTVLLPVRSTGVQGDVRAYGATVVLRAIDSVDAMTAAPSKLPQELVEKIAARIASELKDSVNRVVFDVSNKPPACIEWE